MMELVVVFMLLLLLFFNTQRLLVAGRPNVSHSLVLGKLYYFV